MTMDGEPGLGSGASDPLTPYTPWQPEPMPGWAPPPPPAPPPAAAPPPRRRGPVVALIVGGALVAGLAIGVPVGLLTRSSSSSSPQGGRAPALTPAPRSPAALAARALYQQALTAMSGSVGFHYVSVSKGGPDNQTITGDAGQRGGGQVITIDSSFGHEQFTLVLLGAIVYFQGNVPALQDQLGVSAARAPSVDGKWITVSSGDGPYTVVAPGITVSDQAQEIAMVPTSSSQVTTGDGVKAIRIAGTVPPGGGSSGGGTVQLDIAADTHLPITQVTTLHVSGATVTSTTTFTSWGTAPSPSAPTGAVAWSTLGASEPPGGYGGGGASPGASPTPSASPGV